MIKKIIGFIFIFVFINLSLPLFAEDSSTKNSTDEVEIPQGIQDARRFEIITLGAMPFVTLDVTMLYSGYQYFQDIKDYRKKTDNGIATEKPEFNPFKTSSYNNEEVFGIVTTSFGICLGIGLTDLLVNLVTRKKEAKRLQNKQKIIIQDSSVKELESMLQYPVVENENQGES